MERYFSVSGVALAVLLASGSVSAAGLYVGVSAGQAAIDASTSEVEAAFSMDDDFVAEGTDLDEVDTGWKGYIGYQFNRFLAIEGGYVDLGKATFETTIVDAPPPYSQITPFEINGTAEADGVNLVAVGAIPLGDSLSIFIKGGGFHWDADFREEIGDTGVTRISRSENNTDWTYGAGLGLFFDGVQLRVEWERFENVGEGIGGREGRDVDLASVGVAFGF